MRRAKEGRPRRWNSAKSANQRVGVVLFLPGRRQDCCACTGLLWKPVSLFTAKTEKQSAPGALDTDDLCSEGERQISLLTARFGFLLTRRWLHYEKLLVGTVDAVRRINGPDVR